jgi:hypothetical protein
MHIEYRYQQEAAMPTRNPDPWLRRLRATATFVQIAALCLAVAVSVIGLIPGSSASFPLPASVLGAVPAHGVDPSAAVDTGGLVAFSVAHPDLAQRLLLIATVLPGLVLIAELARRLGRLLRAAEGGEPFTLATVEQLTRIAIACASGGLVVWLVRIAARGGLAATVLDSDPPLNPDPSLLGWFGVALVFAAFARLVRRAAVLRDELDAVI